MDNVDKKMLKGLTTALVLPAIISEQNLLNKQGISHEDAAKDACDYADALEAEWIRRGWTK